MTAMPPTTGHWNLIQFASLLAPKVEVIVCTQPHEPFPNERVEALQKAVAKRSDLAHVTIQHFNKPIEQNPEAPGFKKLWRNIMRSYGCKEGDIIVASEAYGQWLAAMVGAEFYPYDIGRMLNSAKATLVRNDPLTHFNDILPEFQPFQRTTITIFGAESTGKTTLSKALAKKLPAHWLFEYARPYLENTINEITTRSMTAIWKGQRALQQHIDVLPGRPFTIQDTDLYSTVGYWQFPHWQATIGECPKGVIEDARALQADLYIITKSNIPFEKDPLRYGGDVREGSDEYWIALCERYKLPYVVLEGQTLEDRVDEALGYIEGIAQRKAKALHFDRSGY